jgi:predicted DNA-binding transcriptional regulator AlpA
MTKASDDTLLRQNDNSTEKPAYIIRPREIAAMLGRKQAWFYANREELEKAGFPKKDKLLGGWSRLAIEQWLARRAGIAVQSSVDEAKAALRRGIAEAKARRDEAQARREQEKARREEERARRAALRAGTREAGGR